MEPLLWMLLNRKYSILAIEWHIKKHCFMSCYSCSSVQITCIYEFKGFRSYICKDCFIKEIVQRISGKTVTVYSDKWVMKTYEILVPLRTQSCYICHRDSQRCWYVSEISNSWYHIPVCKYCLHL
jgi:hypothetical protein